MKILEGKCLEPKKRPCWLLAHFLCAVVYTESAKSGDDKKVRRLKKIKAREIHGWENGSNLAFNIHQDLIIPIK